MKTISIINLKGGVGKSISAINIAHILVTVHKKRVLLIDNDKQGNVSKFFGVHDYEKPSISDVLTGRKSMYNAMCHTKYEDLYIIPSNMNLLTADREILLDVSRPQQTRLQKALKEFGQSGIICDYCIIDNAPDINMSVINALVASQDVLVPIKVDKFAFDGLSQLVDQIEDIKEFNPLLRLCGCFITMDSHYNVNLQGAEWLENNTEYPLFQTSIRKTCKIDETTFNGKPILEYAKNSNAAKDYVRLVDEYLQKWGYGGVIDEKNA